MIQEVHQQDPQRGRRRWSALASTGVLCGPVGVFPLHGLAITDGNEMIYPCSDASTRRFFSLHNVAENLRQAIIFAALLPSVRARGAQWHRPVL